MDRVRQRLRYRLHGRGCEILVGRDLGRDAGSLLRAAAADPRVLVVTDAPPEAAFLRTLADGLEAEGFRCRVHRPDPARPVRTIGAALRLYTILREEAYARDSLVVAVGGRAVGDLAGFVAGTYLRGMPFAHVPTTLTAMIHGTVGGRVGLDFRRGINVVGTYCPPTVTLVDLDRIPELEEEVYRSGIAEALKCAWIGDADLEAFLMEETEAVRSRRPAAVRRLVTDALAVTVAHVRDDAREEGRGLLLQYGHTIAHAAEAVGLFAPGHRHGEWVALGMLGAARIAEEVFGVSGPVRRLEEALGRYGLPVRVASERTGLAPEVWRNRCLEHLRLDRKRRGGTLRFVLPRSVGRCGIVEGISEETVVAALVYLTGTSDAKTEDGDDAA